MSNLNNNEKNREAKLKQERVLSKHQIAEEDYDAQVGTSEGLTDMSKPNTEKEHRNYVDSTDTDYSKP